MKKEKRQIIQNSFLDGNLTATKNVMRTVYQRNDGTEFIRGQGYVREVVNNTVEFHVTTIRKVSGKDFLTRLKSGLK